MPSCAFRKCNNNSRNVNKAKDVTFHSFPQEPRWKEKWTKIIQVDQSDEEWLPTKFSRVCSEHFKESDFFATPRGLRKLKLDAVPAFRPTTEPSDATEYIMVTIPADRHSSPLRNVDVSATDSIPFDDTPTKMCLKKQLRIEKIKREKYRREVIKLKRQNKYLKTKNTSLREIVKSMRNFVKNLKWKE